MKINKKQFKNILSKNVKDLKSYCRLKLIKSGYTEFEIIGKETDEDPGYLFAKGNMPVLLVAHLDRESTKDGCKAVKELGKKIYKIDDSLIDEVENGTVWTHPYQICGDDRCGVYLILKLIKKYKVSVLFTDKEEGAPYGRTKFHNSKYLEFIKNEIKYMCQIDRQGNNDIVYYDCKKNKAESLEFKDYIERMTGYKEIIGSMTDIVDLTNWTGVSSFNISCGYYNQHNLTEYINLNDMIKTYEALDRLLSDAYNSSYFRINLTN